VYDNFWQNIFLISNHLASSNRFMMLKLEICRTANSLWVQKSEIVFEISACEKYYMLFTSLNNGYVNIFYDLVCSQGVESTRTFYCIRRLPDADAVFIFRFSNAPHK